MTFENVAAASRKVKSSSADRLRALVAYVRIRMRCLLMAARLKRVVTRACRTEIGAKRNVQQTIYPLYIPLFPLPFGSVCSLRPVFLSREINANCVNGRQLFCTSKLCAFHNVLYIVFSIYQPGKPIRFSRFSERE